MRSLLISLAFAVAASDVAAAQAPSPPPGSALGGVYVGEPAAGLRPVLGDPIYVASPGGTQIARYLTLDGGALLDVMLQSNLVRSVTIVSRAPKVSFVGKLAKVTAAIADVMRTRNRVCEYIIEPQWLR